jgi:hypothetical protein
MNGECLQSIPASAVVIPATVTDNPLAIGSSQKQHSDEGVVAYSQSFETKYLLLRTTDKAKLLLWLRSLCQVDRQFPAAIVHSIYFDTRDWQLLRDKVESNFIKLKVRLRWYSDPTTGTSSQSAFLEVKRRVGSQREKRRLLFPFSGPELSRHGCNLEVGRVVQELLPQLGMTLPRGLFPAFEVRYHRRRFVDPVTQSRMCVDSDICVPIVYPTRAHDILHLPLDRVVMELKGPTAELPRHLKIEPALIAEAARWGDVHGAEPFTSIRHWKHQKQRILLEWFHNRSETVLEQLRQYWSE